MTSRTPMTRGSDQDQSRVSKEPDNLNVNVEGLSGVQHSLLPSELELWRSYLEKEVGAQR